MKFQLPHLAATAVAPRMQGFFASTFLERRRCVGWGTPPLPSTLYLVENPIIPRKSDKRPLPLFGRERTIEGEMYDVWMKDFPMTKNLKV